MQSQLLSSIAMMLATHSCRILPRVTRETCKRFSSSYRTVKEFDVLFLRQQGVKFPKWHLTAPIRHDAHVKLSYGASVAASDLIGKQILERTVDDQGNTVAIHEPTLASYIVNSVRSATPIYPSDAETIVSLLELNPTRPGEDDDDQGRPDNDGAPFEVFEAGTGMGSLSLHIARALHAANPPVSAHLRHVLRSSPLARNVVAAGNVLELPASDAAILAAYRASRRAVLHTLDRSGKHTRAAYKLVRHFRRAQYLADMDFHVGTVDDYVAARLAASGGRPIFARAVLDLPAAHTHGADRLIRALHPNAVLVLFNPSISQIAEFQSWALTTGAPLRLEKVLELPTTSTADGVRDGGCGGRHWDVKIVRPKPAPSEDGTQGACPSEEQEPVVVMRPKVGGRVAGGGFIAVYRKWPEGVNRQQPEEPEEEAEE
ncbi:tRNA (adenine-N(1)-)-methyltransferase [Cordyceps fumosorosea ARSEF 2679]|uniref:tRNA (adenine(58)-N(1))-methyltransferase catalytic subunit TRM61 n=1 Tax=Cordyceps fumosorosea (strain ARSEF 2679) TaxID=1081104 RepID=A0A167NE29_CORFA|nr:tRNA (adenine-N(1)-)-methyltransferase [Cordyceps fumosorosea ARSEF 2679]OAA55454.1 tRNA (adenine-N(1)-)-methyltransferase [Cordyceps fumosorosea ARSEF 2679]